MRNDCDEAAVVYMVDKQRQLVLDLTSESVVQKIDSGQSNLGGIYPYQEEGKTIGKASAEELEESQRHHKRGKRVGNTAVFFCNTYMVAEQDSLTHEQAMEK